MYVPPDEPIKSIGEVNMTFDHDSDYSHVRRQGDGAQQRSKPIGIETSTTTDGFEATASVNPIYQR